MEFPEFQVKISAIIKVYGLDYEFKKMEQGEGDSDGFWLNILTKRGNKLLSMAIHTNNPPAWKMHYSMSNMWYGYESGFKDIKERIVAHGHYRIQNKSKSPVRSVWD